MTTFFSIGHSTRALHELIDIFEGKEIKLLADVRAIPRSRTNPQFNRDTLPHALGEHGIDYVHMTELGGRRGRQHDRGPSPNTFWQNDSFRNFADYAMTEPFRHEFIRLQELGASQRCAIMCSELLWWRCHRRIIADYLMLAGHAVIHIFDRAKEDEAHPTPAARRAYDGTIVYAAPERSAGDLFTCGGGLE